MLSRIKNLNVELGSPLRKEIDKKILNKEIRNCNIKLLNRTFRFLKLSCEDSPQFLLLKEIELLESTIAEAKNAINSK